MRSYIRIFSAAIISLLMVTTQVSLAADAKNEPKKSENTDSDKLDIQKLEQKYWSAKDDDFTVIQNRAFTKAQRFFITPTLGVPFNDPNLSGQSSGVNFGYYFNEKFGLELNYATANYKFNDTINTYFGNYGALPDFNTLKSTTSLMAYWVPIYAKMSLLDKKIIYFDMGLGLGVGTTAYDQNICIAANGCNASSNNPTVVSKTGASHYAFNVMQQYYISEHWAFRIDFKNVWSTEERLVSKNGNALGSKQVNDTSLLFGITYWFSLKKQEQQ